MKEGSTLNAPQTLSLARQLKVELVPNGDGLRAIGPREAITELAPHLTACKPELVRLLAQASNDPDPPTSPPPATPTTAAPAPRGDAYQRWRDAWQQQADAYYGHHFTCPVCIASGKGYGARCGVGAVLWLAYTDASNTAGDAP